jgi:hypothetical protein
VRANIRLGFLIMLISPISAGHVVAAPITLSSWTPQYEGIDQARAALSSSVAYIDRVDLSAPGIGFTTTPQSGPLATTAQTTSQFLQSPGTQVAINANFFAPCCNAAPEAKSLIGLEVSNGAVVSSQAFGSADAAASLLLSRSNQATIAAPATSPLDLSNTFNAVSGNIILTDGVDTSSVTPTGAPHDPFGLDPRTAAGLSQDGRYLYLVVVDGRQPGYSTGVTTSDEANLLLSIGAYQGLNLDGGGSTVLVQSEAGTSVAIDQPSGGIERYDGNNFGVYAGALPVPEPGTVIIMATGIAGLLIRRRRLRSPEPRSL